MCQNFFPFKTKWYSILYIYIPLYTYIPLYVSTYAYTKFWLSIHLLMDTWVASTFQLLWILLLWTWVYISFNSIIYIPRIEIAESYGNSISNIIFLETVILFSTGGHHLTFLLTVRQIFSFSISFPALVIPIFLTVPNLVGIKWYFMVILVFPVAQMVKNLPAVQETWVQC